jgi:hypothetical protein
MKEIYKNPVFYYIVTPIVIALWPLLVWAVYLPTSQENLEDDMAKYQQAQDTITQILALDPSIVRVRNKGEGAIDFDYGREVHKVTNQFKIPPTSYELSSKPPRTTRGQKTQDGRVTLKGISIKNFAEFFATIKMRWPELQCETLTLTKQKDLPDAWRAEMQFKYYF